MMKIGLVRWVLICHLIGERRMDKTFAEVWTEAQRERSEYFRAILNGMWLFLRMRREQANEARAGTHSVQHRDLANAA